MDMVREGIGLLGFDSIHFVVEDIERSRRFYEKLDFHEIARAGDELTARGGQRSVVFAAGEVCVCVSAPVDAKRQSKAARYLRHHPAGVMSLGLRVKSLDRAMAFLESRGGTFLGDPIADTDAQGGRYRAVEIATPLGDVAFRFVEREDYHGFAPGFAACGPASLPPNTFGIRAVDHATCNGLTMQPIVAFYRDVLGLEPFWEVTFHTADVPAEVPADVRADGPASAGADAARHTAKAFAAGSGLRSIVMWDPASQVKFATNEPLRPQYRESQIYKFVEDNEGAGVQHVAFGVADILGTVEELKRRGVEFMDTPAAYYLDLPRRLEALGIHNLHEELGLLEKHRVLLDGSHDAYMLQIFLREARALYSDERAGPFFYEIIQRCGDQGFGYGNFRALFESIERAQTHADGAGAAAGSEREEQRRPADARPR
jgi:4-hydroxyphenylpyruvate dioxygenase